MNKHKVLEKEYKVIELLGEGSFGRVYKAKRLTNSMFVALKVICKKGRTESEVKGLKQECEILRSLDHPNIIKMLDSFDTENELVVITEFAHKALNIVLAKEGYLPEERVQPIVWDLVSALYYLHSHRVLHRDLKPQNILLDSKNRAKLCDFGFARNMSIGTHVVTSVKGTPLYMAPELIKEQPYDHNADLWSLGCIIYELLMGAPPFCTPSIIALINLIKNEQIQWPTCTSIDCTTFLQGLLQKNPSNRLSWSDILNHPFVQGHILILENDTTMPLTRVLSENTLQAKEQQRKDYVANKARREHSSIENKAQVQDAVNNNLDLQEKIERMSLEDSKTFSNQDSKDSEALSGTKLNFLEENHPIETEEWIVFLQKSMEELINGEFTSLIQPNLTNILVSPLRNSNSAPTVLGHVAKLFSLPLVIRGIPEDSLLQIRKNYLQVKLIPNLVYSSKLICRAKKENVAGNSSSMQENSLMHMSELSEESLQSLECIYLLIVHLIYLDKEFLIQYCDALMVLNVFSTMGALLSCKSKTNLVADILAVLTHILRIFPENSELVDRIILGNELLDVKQLNFVELLRHSEPILRSRGCLFLMFLGKHSNKIELLWNETVRETLEALMYDSIESVRNTADKTVEELKNKEFYQVIVERPEDSL